MVSIPLTAESILNVKRALSEKFPTQKSSHLTEALAAACGYRSHAALLAEMRRVNPTDPDFVLLNDRGFLLRLRELDGKPTPVSKRIDVFENLAYPNAANVIRTKSRHGREYKYTSARSCSWRNMMIAGINAGIAQRVFTVRAGDNRWPRSDREPAGIFRFSVGNIPAVASVTDAGWDELSIHVAFWPTDSGDYRVAAINAGFRAGDAFASGWLERKDGAWLQASARPSFCCRRSRLQTVASLDLSPKGYADCGDFVL